MGCHLSGAQPRDGLDEAGLAAEVVLYEADACVRRLGDTG
jgi:hypothetical protein